MVLRSEMGVALYDGDRSGTQSLSRQRSSTVEVRSMRHGAGA